MSKYYTSVTLPISGRTQKAQYFGNIFTYFLRQFDIISLSVH